MSTAADENLDEVVKEFLVESYENLDQLDRDLVALEREPGSRDTLSSVFRTIHTLKGTCGFLGFGRLEGVAHVGENLLSKLRDGKLALNAEITSALLSMVDAVRSMLATIAADGNDGEEDYASLIGRLDRLQSDLGAASEATDARAEAASATIRSEPEKAAGLAETTIRVDVMLLDKLMNLVGELVLARNQILQLGSTSADPAFTATTQRLNLITTELQAGVMKTRMQPIGNIWAKFPRVVRDLAIACGKEVGIEMEGRDTELDRTIIEAIKDPLTHLVRNAVDHGIEPPAERARAGKPTQGRLFMRAFHEGGQVNIEISDDGKGIDPESLRAKAVQKGLVAREQAARLSDSEALSLIFLPGFSTAEKITNLSGRGVGMDVVKTNIEKIGGMIDIQSQPGRGTTLKMKIPLTLAIIPALIVCNRSQRYAIPQVSLLELVRLEGEQARGGIERVLETPVYRLRGRLLPLVYLSELLGEECHGSAGAAAREDAVNIVVLQADDRRFGLVVEAISDTEEIVVKPLGKQLETITSFAGATIMGDGRVALILDVLGVAQQAHVLGVRQQAHVLGVRQQAHVLSEVGDRGISEQRQSVAEPDDARQAVLILAVGKTGRVAMPLAMVDRLEELPRSLIEHSSQQQVVQYRGGIMPLLRLEEVLGYEPVDHAEPADPLKIVVYTEAGRSAGIVVDRILDIVEDTIDMRREVARPGLQGSAVIGDRVTDLLDVRALIEHWDPGFASGREAA